MDQMIVISGLVAVLAIGFVLYPQLMFRVLGAALRGFVSLLADCVALLLAWI